MDNRSIILTIAIPTYNRPDFIKKSVRSILPQLTNNVCLVVYDNCSSIPVRNLFNENELSKFSIVRNHVNIGGDANILRCIESVESGWCWVLGDDDTISLDAIDIIMETIHENPEVCYINFGNNNNVKTQGLDELLSHWNHIGTFGHSYFISRCLFNMNKLKNSIIYYYQFLSSQIGQIAMVIKYIEHNAHEFCLFSKRELVYENSYPEWSMLDFIYNSSILIDKFYYIKKVIQKNIIKNLCHEYFRFIALSKCSYSSKLYALIFIFKRIGLYQIIRYNFLSVCNCLAILFIPSYILEHIKDKIKKIKHR